MRLDYYYKLDEDEILNQIKYNNAHSKHSILKNQGYRYMFDNNENHIIAWQSMKIHIGLKKINTYIMIKIKTNSENKIIDIELVKDFIGSQGIKCNRDILNQHIKEVFIDENLSTGNLKIKNSKNSWCRHIYELLYGSCYFLKYVQNNNLKNAFYYEENYVKPKLGAFEFINKINLNNNKSVYKLVVDKILSTKLEPETCAISKTEVKLSSNLNDDKVLHSEIVGATSNSEFYQNMITVLQKNLDIVSKKINLEGLYNFSILLPSTLYSYIVQIMTILITKGKNDALNKCLKNFQRINNVPSCIGFLMEQEEMNDNI